MRGGGGGERKVYLGMDLIKKVRGHLIYVGTMGTCGERALVQLLTSPRPLPHLIYYPGGQPGPFLPEWMPYC